MVKVSAVKLRNVEKYKQSRKLKREKRRQRQRAKRSQKSASLAPSTEPGVSAGHIQPKSSKGGVNSTALARKKAKRKGGKKFERMKGKQDGAANAKLQRHSGESNFAYLQRLEAANRRESKSLIPERKLGDHGRKRVSMKRKKDGDKGGRGMGSGARSTSSDVAKYEMPSPNDLVAIDCEMVGVGSSQRSEVARVSIVDFDGRQLLDLYVRPRERVTNYRTKWSGIRKADLIGATPFDDARETVLRIMHGRYIVGHALENDLTVLDIDHSREKLRDTARYYPLMQKNKVSGKMQPRSLKSLADDIGVAIQRGEHSSLEDARASMLVYRKHRDAWEKYIEGGGRPHSLRGHWSSDPSGAASDPFASSHKKRKR